MFPGLCGIVHTPWREMCSSLKGELPSPINTWLLNAWCNCEQKKSTKCKGYLYEIACLLKIWPWLDTPHIMWWTCRMHIVLIWSQFYSLLKEFYFCWYWSQAAATCKLYIICCTYQFCFWIRDFGSRSQLDNSWTGLICCQFYEVGETIVESLPRKLRCFWSCFNHSTVDGNVNELNMTRHRYKVYCVVHKASCSTQWHS